MFLQEIRSVGLGATNPHAQLRTLEFLRDLLSSMRGYQQDGALSAPEIAFVEAMLSQSVTASKMNFRHGATYLTPSRFTAVRYALRNRYGSELLSTAFCLFEKLSALNGRVAEELADRYPEACGMFQQKHEPVLIEINDVPVEQLRSEVGGDVAGALRIMQDEANTLEPKMLNVLWQQSNFELLSCIPPGCLLCFRINWLDGDTDTPSYELEAL